MSDFGRSRNPVARKPHRCEYCYGPIPKGEKHYHYTGVWHGEFQNWRMHNECLEDCQQNCDPDDGFMPGEAPWPDRVKAMKEAA